MLNVEMIVHILGMAIKFYVLGTMFDRMLVACKHYTSCIMHASYRNFVT